MITTEELRGAGDMDKHKQESSPGEDNVHLRDRVQVKPVCSKRSPTRTT